MTTKTTRPPRPQKIAALPRLQRWPFVPSNPPAWALLRSAWPSTPADLGFVGHAEGRFFFQQRGIHTPITVTMTADALALLDGNDYTSTIREEIAR